MDGVINLIKNDKSEEEFQNEVRAKLKDFSKKMDNLNQGIEKLHSLMMHSTDRIIADTRLQGYETFRQQLNEELNYIETKYMNSIAPIISNLSNYDLQALNEHLKPILENGILEEKLIRIKFSSELHGKTHREETKNLFGSVAIISKDQKDKHLECNDISVYDKLFFYYDYVVKMVTQGYNMLLWTYQYRRLQDHDHNVINKNLQLVLQNRQKEAVVKITEAAQHHLRLVDNISWRSAYACDPERWEEGKNYIRVKPFKPKGCGGVPNCEASRPTLTELPSIFSLMLVSCDTSKYE
ncbi:Protein of unknown function [Cotesia congregata]|uniref:Uncharacterized protein n=1 Tax=Cotesia congregata TaxID=51543 RepID=A0A8J2H211_COTCN|nr:Protein of unknown function [Cotesia congregata]